MAKTQKNKATEMFVFPLLPFHPLSLLPFFFLMPPAAPINVLHNLVSRSRFHNRHIGLLKAKLAKLRREQLGEGKSKSGGPGEGFDVAKSGASRIGMIGFPSVGKSTLLTKLTGTFSEAASYEFTTLTVRCVLC